MMGGVTRTNARNALVGDEMRTFVEVGMQCLACYKPSSITRLVAAFHFSLSVSGVSLDRIEVDFINDTEAATGPNPCGGAVRPRGRFRV